MTTDQEKIRGLEERRFAVFDGAQEGASLAALAAALLARQKENWPGLSAGYDALGNVRVREIRGEGWGVMVQFNPRRIVSTGANLDPEFLRRRPCFLCPDHLPSEQQAILYREEYLILCNPMPIFPGHLTIAHRLHLPQAITERLPALLKLAADFGTGTTLLYNGPRAGASAPDHLHFQAAPAGFLPVEKQVGDSRRRTATKRHRGVEICRTAGLGRGILLIEGNQEGDVAAAAAEAIGALGRLNPSEGEPLLNLMCTSTGAGWRLILFPRRKSRPDAYFKEGPQGLLISPGAVDMAGIIITPREEDFLALTPEIVQDLYREVAFDDGEVDELLASL